jgi:glutaredoxin
MRLVLLLALLAPLASAAGEIYKWVDENGQVHYSDQKPEDQAATEMAVDSRSYQGVSYGTIDVNIRQPQTGNKIVMLSAAWCGVCKKAKTYFRRKGILFREYDIDKSSRGKKLYQQLGASGVPVILVGYKRMNGFSESGFQRLLRQ